MTATVIDPIERLRAALKADLAGKRTTILDGTKPCNMVVDGMDWEEFSPMQLPLIQFGAIDSPAQGGYMTRSAMSFPFSIRFIAWVFRGTDPRAADNRARNMRHDLLQALHQARTFSNVGAARDVLRYTLEATFYRNKIALGAGLIVSGDILNSLEA